MTTLKMKMIGSQRIVMREVNQMILEDKLRKNVVVDPILKVQVKMPRTVVLRKIDNLQKSLDFVKRIIWATLKREIAHLKSNKLNFRER